MEKLKKIKSIHILETIFNYIKGNKIKYKLFVYSKYFQKKLKLTLLDYQENYFSNNGLKFADYIYNPNIISKGKFYKNFYEKKIEKDLKKIKVNRKDFDKIVYSYFIGMEEKLKLKYSNELESIDNQEVLIDIYSPFFEIISKSKIFSIFTIPISIKMIKKYNLKKDYYSVFDKLNNLNINLSSLIIYYNNIDDINYLEELGINYKNIKKISLYINLEENDDEEEEEYEEKDENEEKEKEICINLKNLFSFDNFGINLLYLKLNFDIDFFGNFKLEPNIMENINNYQSLRILEVFNYRLENNFEININKLKSLSVYNCTNISLVGENGINMNKLIIFKSLISKPKSLIKFPNLEECSLTNKKNQNFNTIIDFSSLKNLKNIECEKSDFIYLDNTLLEEIKLNSKINNTIEIEKKVIEKLINIKTLKNVDFILSEINNEQISQIKGENLSVINLIINWNTCDIPSKLDGLQNKFPNLSYFRLNLPYYTNFENSDYQPIIKIKPKENSKITKFTLDIGNNDCIECYCSPYSKLEEVNIFIIEKIENLRNVLPIFGENCKIKFESLTKFHFDDIYEINFDFIKNIYNNLD